MRNGLWSSTPVRFSLALVMNTPQNLFTVLVAIAGLAHATQAEADIGVPQTPDHPDSRPAREPSLLEHFDVEVDPIAYIAEGHSLHLGFRTSWLRFDLGSFSIVIPEFVHRQRGFEDQARGYGAKLDVYLLEPSSGPFIGAEGGWLEQEIIHLEQSQRAVVSSFMGGVRVGWELPVGARFYVRPWVGINYRFGNDELNVAEATFEQAALGFFPTVHVGYVFH